jgi:hypothetical protein
VSARELASIFFGRSRKGVIVSLRVYLDGSGKEEVDPVITVGGFLADCDLCETIEDEWEQATGGKVFHLTDFGTPSCKLGSASWSGTDRTAFLKRLAGIVNRPGCLILSTSVEVAQYNSFIERSPHPHVHGPVSSACATSSIKLAEMLLELENRHQQKTAYIFEKGDRQHELAKMMADWDRKTDSPRSELKSLSFQPKATTLLQPADLIAGTVQKCMLSAFGASHCLKNGKSRTRLNTFERYYSEDGVTSTVVSGHDNWSCWVANTKLFEMLDTVTDKFFQDYPKQLEKRLKQAPYRPKQKKAAGR